jgi:hypothetical protein
MSKPFIIIVSFAITLSTFCTASTDLPPKLDAKLKRFIIKELNYIHPSY